MKNLFASFKAPKNKRKLFLGLCSLPIFFALATIFFVYFYKPQKHFHTKNPKVSVIIPVYNSEKYLPETLSHVLNQTLKDIEVVCVLDGSPDNSKNVLLNFQKKDDRVIIVEQANGGVSAARNTGIKHASGEYLFYLDSDDIVTNNICEVIYNLAKKYDADTAYFRHVYFKDGEEIPWEKYNDDPSLIKVFTRVPNKEPIENLSFSGYSVCEKFWKRQFVLDNDLYFKNDVRQGEDDLYNLVAAQKVKINAKNNNAMLFCRIRPNSITTSYSLETRLQNILRIIGYIMSDLSIFDFENPSRWLFTRILELCNANTIVQATRNLAKRAKYAQIFFDLTDNFIKSNVSGFTISQINQINALKNLLIF